MSKAAAASSNWLALQKKIGPSSNKHTPRKRRKLEHVPSEASSAPVAKPSPSASPAKLPESATQSNGDSNAVTTLRDMVHGKLTFTDAQKQPGKYLALDCEMVGVGLDGSESSLARVSLVNYYGYTILDEFVRQRERVVDYRTQFSGIRESDMIHAKPFDDIQKTVAALLKDRILVGHAVHNDLKALLLSHPWPQTRDTQVYAGKFKVMKSKWSALRNLVKQELDITIQAGEHSSVTDARATMAVYRTHKKEWEKGSHDHPTTSSKKRKQPDDAEDGGHGGRKGISSGLSVIVTRKGEHKGRKQSGNLVKQKKEWWKEVPHKGK